MALATDGPIKPPEVRLVVDQPALPRGHTKPGERCEIEGVGPIPVAMARELLDDASVTFVARDGDDITAVSASTRTIPTRLRRALETRYPVCGADACDNERGLQIDHVVELHQGGSTSLDNTWRLCAHHHALKTYGGWHVVGDAGHWDLVLPDGRDPPG